MRLIIFFLLLASGSFANPTVSNIRVAQRENTKLVDILYDVNFVGGDTVAVSCEVSTNAGASFDIPVSSFSGDGYGAIVSNGSDRLIVWNAGIDWDENYSEQMMVRITATPPRFIDNGDGTVTDNKSGLIWAKTTQPFLSRYDAIVSLSEGWRLPTYEEFQALADASTPSGMPYGHPFIISSDVYWTSSIHELNYQEDGLIVLGFSFYDDDSVAGNNSAYLITGILINDTGFYSLLTVKDSN